MFQNSKQLTHVCLKKNAFLCFVIIYFFLFRFCFNVVFGLLCSFLFCVYFKGLEICVAALIQDGEEGAYKINDCEFNDFFNYIARRVHGEFMAQINVLMQILNGKQKKNNKFVKIIIYLI